jgi:hypothetical protein
MNLDEAALWVLDVVTVDMELSETIVAMVEEWSHGAVAEEATNRAIRELQVLRLVEALRSVEGTRYESV